MLCYLCHCRLNVVPGGIFDLLTWLSQRYANPPFLITENGCDVPGESEMSLNEALHDSFRVNYYSSYLRNVMRAMDSGVDVRGYFAWSLMVCTCIVHPHPCYVVVVDNMNVYVCI